MVHLPRRQNKKMKVNHELEEEKKPDAGSIRMSSFSFMANRSTASVLQLPKLSITLPHQFFLKTNSGRL